FFFQAEDGIRDRTVTGVQTCALPIWAVNQRSRHGHALAHPFRVLGNQLTALICQLEKLQQLAGALLRHGPRQAVHAADKFEKLRSEERRVGKECRTRRAEDHEKKKKE